MDEHKLEKLRRSDRDSMKLLLNQYEKDLKDIENETGIYKTKSKAELESIKSDIIAHIESLKKTIDSFDLW